MLKQMFVSDEESSSAEDEELLMAEDKPENELSESLQDRKRKLPESTCDEGDNNSGITSGCSNDKENELPAPSKKKRKRKLIDVKVS